MSMSPRTTRSWLPARHTSTTSETTSAQSSGWAPYPTTSPRHQTCSGSWLPTSASTAFRAGRLLWMSEMTATRMGDLFGHRHRTESAATPPGGDAVFHDAQVLWAAWPAVEREPLEHGVRLSSLVAELSVEQEERAVAHHRGVYVVDRPPAPPHREVASGDVEEGHRGVRGARQGLDRRHRGVEHVSVAGPATRFDHGLDRDDRAQVRDRVDDHGR